MTPKEIEMDDYLKTEIGLDSKQIIDYEVLLKKDLVALINLTLEEHPIMRNYPLTIKVGARVKVLGFTDMQKQYVLIEAVDSPFQIKDIRVVLRRLIDAIK